MTDFKNLVFSLGLPVKPEELQALWLRFVHFFVHIASLHLHCSLKNASKLSRTLQELQVYVFLFFYFYLFLGAG